MKEVGDALNAEGKPSPALAAAARLYARPTEVHAPMGSLVSERGVVQGCPAGSPLYDLTHAAAMHAASIRLAGMELQFRPMEPLDKAPQRVDNLIYHVSLHDDLVLASSSPGSLVKAHAVLAEVLADRGLTLAPGKAVVLGKLGSVQDLAMQTGAVRQHATLFAGAPLYVDTQQGRGEAEGLLLEYAVEKMDVVRKALRMESPQDIVRVLVSAGTWSRLHYAHSLTHKLQPWEIILPAADALSREGLAKALGQHAQELGSIGWLVAVLKSRFGGLGIPSCEVEAGVPSLGVFKALDASENPGDLAAGQRQRIHKRREKIASGLAEVVRQVCADDPLKLTRLAHGGRRTSSNIWSINACARDHTLLGSKVASKVLHIKLLGNPTPPGTTFACGEKKYPMPAIGSDSVTDRHHLDICSKNAGRRHFAGLQAVIAIADQVAPRVMDTEQSVDALGAPCPPSDEERRRPGDLVCNAGPRKWIYADLTVSGQIEDIRKEREPGSKHCMVLQAAKSKIHEYRNMFVHKESVFRPLAFSVFGGSSALTNGALQELANAVESQAPAGAPLGSTPLWIRFRDACTVQALAAPAQLALELAEANGQDGPAADNGLPFHGDPDGDQRLWEALRQKGLARLEGALLVVPREQESAEGCETAEGDSSSTGSEEPHDRDLEGPSSRSGLGDTQGLVLGHTATTTAWEGQRSSESNPGGTPCPQEAYPERGTRVPQAVGPAPIIGAPGPAERIEAHYPTQLRGTTDPPAHQDRAQARDTAPETLHGGGDEGAVVEDTVAANQTLPDGAPRGRWDNDQELGRWDRPGPPSPTDELWGWMDVRSCSPRTDDAPTPPPDQASCRVASRRSSNHTGTGEPRMDTGGATDATRMEQTEGWEQESQSARSIRHAGTDVRPSGTDELEGGSSGSAPGNPSGTGSSSSDAAARVGRRRRRGRRAGRPSPTLRSRPQPEHRLARGPNRRDGWAHESGAMSGPAPPPGKTPRSCRDVRSRPPRTDDACAPPPDQASCQMASRCSLNQTGTGEPRIEASGAIDATRTVEVEQEFESARAIQQAGTDARPSEAVEGGLVSSDAAPDSPSSPGSRSRDAGAGAGRRRRRDPPAGGPSSTLRSRPQPEHRLARGPNGRDGRAHESGATAGPGPPPGKTPRSCRDTRSRPPWTDDACAPPPDQASCQMASRCSLNQTGTGEPRIEASGAIDATRIGRVEELVLESPASIQGQQESMDLQWNEADDGGPSELNWEGIGRGQLGPGSEAEEFAMAGPNWIVGAGVGAATRGAPP